MMGRADSHMSPTTAPDRVPCINPRCRRTAPRRPGDGQDARCICPKCWKVLPPRLRARHKQLSRVTRRLHRALDRGRYRERAPLWIKTEQHLWDAWGRWNSEVSHYFREPDRPIGLEAFMEETGL